MKFSQIYLAMFFHNFKNIVLSVLIVLLLVIGQLYLCFDDDIISNLIQLFGGVGSDNSIIFGFIKLAFVLVIILQTSKTIDTLQSNFTQFLSPRLDKKSRLFVLYYLFIILLIFILTILFYGVFYLLVDISDYKIQYFIYVGMDLLSIISMITLFLVFETVFRFTHSLLIIIGVYILNLFLPFTNIVAINGCGKSVMFKIISGFLRATSGSVFYNNKEVGKDIDFLPDLGVLIEKPGFIEEYTHVQNLLYLASIKNKIGKKEIKKFLLEVGLDPDLKQKVKNFSLGMRQRLAICQAIMEDQKIIILDEPFNGLDKSGQLDMKQLIKKLRDRDKIVLLTSHIEGDIDELADEIYEFVDGSIVKIN